MSACKAHLRVLESSLHGLHQPFYSRHQAAQRPGAHLQIQLWHKHLNHKVWGQGKEKKRMGSECETGQCGV